MQTIFVTGAAGFIGSNLVDRLLDDGKTVVGWDNLSTGRMQFLKSACNHPRFRLVRGDNLDLPALTEAMGGCDFVVHLAANADVRFGIEHPSRDFEQNTRATFHVLEAMRCNGVRSIAFSSTGSIYGEAEIIPTPENHSFPTQTSLYGASKLAGEGMIQAYCEGFGMNAYLFRFVSILGPRYTHGHVIDFYRQLLDHPGHLDVLGDGTQRKSYLHVTDCLNAILKVVDKETAKNAKHGVQIYNLGTNEYCQVRDSIGWISEHLDVSPEIRYSGGDRGWIGDNPFIFLETSKIRAEGWAPEFTIRKSVVETLKWIGSNHWILAQ
ncbi:MAG TPA: NAD-dependent epimerase/dehydratase family protein [Bryobacteraceae bacterium]|jgi:UDP-glucose 4-epimerase|nr:NAD-dependent epimerase/dehydratase family protein [Bryobacteraceae bacterium]